MANIQPFINKIRQELIDPESDVTVDDKNFYDIASNHFYPHYVPQDAEYPYVNLFGPELEYATTIGLSTRSLDTDDFRFWIHSKSLEENDLLRELVIKNFHMKKVTTDDFKSVLFRLNSFANPYLADPSKTQRFFVSYASFKLGLSVKEKLS